MNRHGGQTIGEVSESKASAIHVFLWSSSWETNDYCEAEADGVSTLGSE